MAGSASSSRAARLSRRTSSAWFAAAGLPLIEGYALTETGGGACISTIEDAVPGVVGRPLPGSEVRIADDGEILLRGPMVMRGYHHLPEATAEVLSADGWFATGDVGELDAAGRLRVTDRKKDLIKTSGGKYIAPQAIEGMFKAICPLASQMLVHGEGRNFATALIALDPDAVDQWGRARGLTSTDHDALVSEPAVHDYVRELRRRAQRPAQPLGDDQGLPDPGPRHVDRGGRAHAQHEGEAEGHRVQIRGVAGLDVPRPTVIRG